VNGAVRGIIAGRYRALMLSAKEIFARQPLPYTEEELARMVAEQQGLPLFHW